VRFFIFRGGQGKIELSARCAQTPGLADQRATMVFVAFGKIESLLSKLLFWVTHTFSLCHRCVLGHYEAPRKSFVIADSADLQDHRWKGRPSSECAGRSLGIFYVSCVLPFSLSSILWQAWAQRTLSALMSPIADIATL
jgi:hypothetical protein